MRQGGPDGGPRAGDGSERPRGSEEPAAGGPSEGGSGRPFVWLLYGAYGYTGRLIAREATERGLSPVLAGRDGSATRRLAETLGLEHRIFALGEADARSDQARVREGLEGVDLVLNAAGPYSRTFRPMVEASLDTGTDYLDITGELSVLEAAHGMDGRAREEGVAVIPAVGMDVVPTDCLAVRAVEKLPGARRIDLAIHSTAGPSPGTARTMVERLGEPGKVRRGGKIVDVPQGSIRRDVPFSDRTRQAVCIPWGDVSTCYHSTGVPDTRVFMTFPPSASRWLSALSAVLRLPGASHVASWMVKRTVSGPSAEERRAGRTRLWCEAADDDRTVRLEMEIPNGYTFTARSAVAAVERIGEQRSSGGDSGPVGFRTPSAAFGAGFVDEIDGVEWIERGG